MDIQDLYNRLCGSNDGRLLRPTAFIAQVEAFPAFAELPLPDSPADPSVRFLGHLLGGVGAVGGLVNYVVWKNWYASWKKRQEK